MSRSVCARLYRSRLGAARWRVHSRWVLALELSFGEVDVVAGSASGPSRRLVESMLSGGVVAACSVSAAGGGVERVTIGCRCGVDLAQPAFGGGDCVVEPLAYVGSLGATRLGGGVVGAGLVERPREPLRDDAACCDCGRCAGFVAARLFGEGASLGDCRDVGSVDGEDSIEDVAGLGDIVALGDDANQILVAAAGGGDV